MYKKNILADFDEKLQPPIDEKKKLKDDPYLRAYNYIVRRRHISAVEDFLGKDIVDWWMRFGTMVLQIVTIMCLLLFLCSCGSHRSTLYQHSNMKMFNDTEKKDTASFVQQVKKTEHEDMTETVEEITTEYDTAMPVDVKTGKPPVKSETKKTTRRDTNKQKQEERVTDISQSASQREQIGKAFETDALKEKKREESTIPRQISWGIWGIVALAALFCVWRMGYFSSKTK